MTITIRPMAEAEYPAFRDRLLEHYSAEIAQARGLPADEARRQATQQTDELLPDGIHTDGQLLFTAVDEAGQPVGLLWLATRSPNGAQAGWIYDVEVDEAHRGKGYGREIMLLAEQECRRHGLTSLRLNVFGTNAVARHLYESLGYEITSQNMAKRLD
jgi:ribosomal protein S18 acetylase RimI-like enzyme